MTLSRANILYTIPLFRKHKIEEKLVVYKEGTAHDFLIKQKDKYTMINPASGLGLHWTMVDERRYPKQQCDKKRP